MKQAFSVSETIARPGNVVWEYLTDPAKMPQWMAGIEDVRVTSSGPIAVGSKLAYSARGRELETTVAMFDSPTTFALANEQKGLMATYTYSCQPEGDHTRLTLTATCTTERMIWKILHPLIGFMLKKADQGQVKAFKTAIEENSNA